MILNPTPLCHCQDSVQAILTAAQVNFVYEFDIDWANFARHLA